MIAASKSDDANKNGTKKRDRESEKERGRLATKWELLASAVSSSSSIPFFFLFSLLIAGAA